MRAATEPVDMYATIAYIAPTTPPWDVGFTKTKLMTNSQLSEYVLAVTQQAPEQGVKLLEIEVFRGGISIWRGLL